MITGKQHLKFLNTMYIQEKKFPSNSFLILLMYNSIFQYQTNSSILLQIQIQEEVYNKIESENWNFHGDKITKIQRYDNNSILTFHFHIFHLSLFPRVVLLVVLAHARTATSSHDGSPHRRSQETKIIIRPSVIQLARVATSPIARASLFFFFFLIHLYIQISWVIARQRDDFVMIVTHSGLGTRQAGSLLD